MLELGRERGRERGRDSLLASLGLHRTDRFPTVLDLLRAQPRFSVLVSLAAVLSPADCLVSRCGRWS